MVLETSQSCHRALYDYAGDPENGQLSFSAGAMLMVLETIQSSGWCRGYVLDESATDGGSSSEGFFPLSYIEKVGEDTPNGESIAVALHAFEGSSEDQLSLEVGTRIIVQDVTAAEGWWWGVYADDPGKRGFFPASFVSLEGAATKAQTEGSPAVTGEDKDTRGDFEAFRQRVGLGTSGSESLSASEARLAQLLLARMACAGRCSYEGCNAVVLDGRSEVRFCTLHCSEHFDASNYVVGNL